MLETLSELMKVIEVSGAQSIQDVYRTLPLTAKDTSGLKLQASSKGYQSICFCDRALAKGFSGKTADFNKEPETRTLLLR